MIDAAQPAGKQAPSYIWPSRSQPGTERDERGGSSQAGPQTAERGKQVAAPNPAFDVRLEAGTMRLYSELRDPRTNRVLLRLPFGYAPQAQPKPPQLIAEA